MDKIKHSWNLVLKSPPKKSPLIFERVECHVVYQKQLERWLADAAKREAWKASFDTALNKQFKAQAEEKCKRAAISFSEGGQLRILVLPEEITSYQWQVALRKALSDLFKSPGDTGLSIHLSTLGKDMQAELLGALGTLMVAAPWKNEVFGKRNQNNEKKSDKKSEKKLNELEVFSTISAAAAQDLISAGEQLGLATNRVRTLAELPGNELTPIKYRQRIQSLIKDMKVTYEFLDRKALLKKGAGAFLAVSQADPNDQGGIAHLSYHPKGAKKTVALVGKGLCFDTGGYNIKTGGGMFGMQRDMTGSAVALALFAYFVERKVDFNVEAWLAIAENHVSPTGFKMNDVVVACDGTAIEVVHTDAEGRMVLSDTLALVRQTKPDLVVDFATLTGSCVRALDTRYTGIFSNRPELARLAVDVGASCGERTWSFPLDEDYREQLKSEIADIQQCLHTNNNADQIYAASFLSHFVGQETPWVHADLSSQQNRGGLGLISTTVTGSGVRWGAHFVTEALKKSWR